MTHHAPPCVLSERSDDVRDAADALRDSLHALAGHVDPDALNDGYRVLAVLELAARSLEQIGDDLAEANPDDVCTDDDEDEDAGSGSTKEAN